MDSQKVTVKVKTKTGEVELPAILEADGTLNIDFHGFDFNQLPNAS